LKEKKLLVTFLVTDAAMGMKFKKNKNNWKMFPIFPSAGSNHSSSLVSRKPEEDEFDHSSVDRQGKLQ
jgi:hypothetical protein